MKISLKLDDNHQNHHHPPPLLLRAKIPVTIFNLPFLSHFSTTTTHPSDHSLSLSTNFPSFPSLKLSYASAAVSSSAAAATPPFTLSLKSGTGLFGSPNNSPLVISAHFSFNPSNPAHPNPTFSLFLKPQLESFSLRKSTSSHPESAISGESISPDVVCDPDSFAFVPLETPAGAVKERPPQKNVRDSIFKGIQLAATTQMPVAKRTALNFRWRVNFAEDQMPVLRINKIGIQRVDDVVAVKDEEKSKENEAKSGELEVLKSMCFWMKREVDVLTRANREMKCDLEEMRQRRSSGGFGGGIVKEGGRKQAAASAGSPIKQWKSAREGCGGEESMRREEKKKSNNNNNIAIEKKNGNNNSIAIDVENELQRAIMASASPSS